MIKTDKKWTASRIRSLCIREDWYTLGSNERYMNMFRFIGSHKPTPGNVYKVARDIQNNSECDQSTEYLENIMFLIGETIMTFYEIQ